MWSGSVAERIKPARPAAVAVTSCSVTASWPRSTNASRRVAGGLTGAAVSHQFHSKSSYAITSSEYICEYEHGCYGHASRAVKARNWKVCQRRDCQIRLGGHTCVAERRLQTESPIVQPPVIPFDSAEALHHSDSALVLFNHDVDAEE